MKRSFNDYFTEEEAILKESSALTKAFALAQYLQFRGEKGQLANTARQLKDVASALDKAKDSKQIISQNARAMKLYAQSLEQITTLLTLIMHVAATSAALAGRDKTGKQK